MGNRRLDKAVINVVFIGGWVGGLLGPVACILGAAAVERRLDNPSRGGLAWALSGALLGFLAIAGALVVVLFSLTSSLGW